MDLSSSWAASPPSWIMLHLDYPTTLNMIKISQGDVPCTAIEIELEIADELMSLELGEAFVKPKDIKMDVSTYILTENLTSFSKEEDTVQLTFRTQEKITGVKLHVLLPSSCQLGEVSLAHLTPGLILLLLCFHT